MGVRLRRFLGLLTNRTLNSREFTWTIIRLLSSIVHWLASSFNRWKDFPTFKAHFYVVDVLTSCSSFQHSSDKVACIPVLPANFFTFRCCYFGCKAFLAWYLWSSCTCTSQLYSPFSPFNQLWLLKSYSCENLLFDFFRSYDRSFLLSWQKVFFM